MDHRVVKNRCRAIVPGGLGVGDVDLAWRPRRRRRGRSSTSARHRAPRGASSAVGQPLGAAAFPDFGSPSNAPFSGRAGRLGATSRQALWPRPEFPSSRITGRPNDDHAKRPAGARPRNMASWNSPRISWITARRETWIWTPRSTCS